MAQEWASEQQVIAVIQFDQGSFHKAKALDCPDNIIPIFQPPHSPELNPIERFWEFLKSKLQWENCKTLAQLQQKLTDALKAITPEMIASLTSYDFILEALFSAASSGLTQLAQIAGGV
ncbi:transposase [Nostoc sp. FACHB-973]|nr:transposase [Nostoc sp. FACHB-973]